MSWGEIVVGIVVLWLLAAGARRLWGHLSGSGRQDRPAAPSRPGSPPAGEPRTRPSGNGHVSLGPSRRVRVDMPVLAGKSHLRRGAPLVVPKRCDPLWMEKGWHQEGNEYRGHFRAAGRRWRGLVQEPYAGRYDVYIWQAPKGELRGHPHDPCFQSNGGDGRFRVHFHHMPVSVDHAIVNVETVLAEALGARP